MRAQEGLPYKSGCPECEIKQLWFETLRFCGCGRQGDVLGIFRDAMQIMHDRSRDIESESAWQEGDEKLKILWATSAPLEALVLYTLCEANLTEHGGSVFGSWLTPLGERLLGFMGTKTTDELDSMLDHDEYDHETE